MLHKNLMKLALLSASFFTLQASTKLIAEIGKRAMERTYAMIKPDAVAAKNAGKIIDLIEQNGFEIVGMKKMQFTKALAEKFYEVHASKPFFGPMTTFITSGPVVALVLKKDNAIADWRKLLGATNPANADVGTIRKMYGKNIDNNAGHGSDAPETAEQEIKLIFSELQ